MFVTMEDRAKILIVTGVVLLIVLGLIFSVVYLLVHNFQGKFQGIQQTQISQSPKPSIVSTDQPHPTKTLKPSDLNFVDEQLPITGVPKPKPVETKSYNGIGFQLMYPKKWGLLTCSNSSNIEFDSDNSFDQIGITCDVARKPVTILVGNITNCYGEHISLGEVRVIRSKTIDGGYIKYRWCVMRPVLDITHRVSSGVDPATSKEDFSKEIEDMISKIHSGGAS